MGIIHRPHPIQGEWNGQEFNDEEELVLYDECPRCDEHSRAILGLDDDNLRALWREMVRVEYKQGRDAFYRSKAEARACRELYLISIFMDRAFDINPRVLL